MLLQILAIKYDFQYFCSPLILQKTHRLLPTNLYVILYNFKARHQDELDLKAGYKVNKHHIAEFESTQM